MCVCGGGRQAGQPCLCVRAFLVCVCVCVCVCGCVCVCRWEPRPTLMHCMLPPRLWFVPRAAGAPAPAGGQDRCRAHDAGALKLPLSAGHGRSHSLSFRHWCHAQAEGWTGVHRTLHHTKSLRCNASRGLLFLAHVVLWLAPSFACSRHCIAAAFLFWENPQHTYTCILTATNCSGSQSRAVCHFPQERAQHPCTGQAHCNIILL